MSKIRKTNTDTHSKSTLKKIKAKGDITEFRLTSNNLRVLYAYRKGSGVVTSNIIYHIGSRDEARGETGIAHMLEHMLFKPTRYDIKRKSEPASMLFERETGIVLNANTWKDRTTYYFSYPSKYFERALSVESERMCGMHFSESEFKPEQSNVLSEYDMYAGDEEFALSVQMMHAAFLSHPYGHETIGYREDIEAYTTNTLTYYYKTFYVPNNATLTIVGDVPIDKVKRAVLKYFGHIKGSGEAVKRVQIREPKQEGARTVTIERPSTKNVYALGVRHDGFPSKAWFETMVIFDLLCGSESSLLYKKLVDTGLASDIHSSLEPTMDNNLGILYVTLSPKATHELIHTRIREVLNTITVTEIKSHLKRTIQKVVTSEIQARENSLGYTAELVEYVSAHAWEAFFDSINILKSIKPQDVRKRIQELFKEEATVMGYFKGKAK